MSDPILFSYRLSGANAGMALDEGAVAAELKADALAWAHLDATHPDAAGWIAENLPYLDRHAIAALTAEETRPRVTELGEGLLLILRGVNLNAGADPADMVSIRLWIDPHRIISLQRRQVFAALDIERRIQEGRGPTDAGAFLALLADLLALRIGPVISALDDSADEIEEELVESPEASLRSRISELRRRTIALRRYVAPQRDVVAELRRCDLPWIDEGSRRRLAETGDRMTRYVEDLDAIRERCQVVKDDLANALADRLNRNTYLLGVIAAIFLPLGFVTGLLGVNVAGIPGAEYPHAFWILGGLCVLLVAVQVAIFRRMKWF